MYGREGEGGVVSVSRGRRARRDQMGQRTASDNVGVGDLDSLGSSGRSTGVHDARHIVGSRVVGLGGVDLAELEELVERVDIDTSVGSLDGLQSARLDILGLAIVHEHLEARRLAHDGGDRAEQAGIAEHAVHLGLVDRVGQPVLTQRVIGRGKGNGLRGAGVGHDLPARRGRAVNVEDGRLGVAGLDESASCILDDRSEPVQKRRVSSQLRTGRRWGCRRCKVGRSRRGGPEATHSL